MKILVIGANGTIGKLIIPVFRQKHEVITAGRNGGDVVVDISSSSSIENMFRQVYGIDACICIAGESATDAVSIITEEQIHIGVRSKLIGQMNLVRIGQHCLNDHGSFTLISGKLGDEPVKHSVGKAFVNGAINSFVKAASLDMQRSIRINAVSPAPIVHVNAAELYTGYLTSVESTVNGQVIRVGY